MPSWQMCKLEASDRYSMSRAKASFASSSFRIRFPISVNPNTMPYPESPVSPPSTMGDGNLEVHGTINRVGDHAREAPQECGTGPLNAEHGHREPGSVHHLRSICGKDQSRVVVASSWGNVFSSLRVDIPRLLGLMWSGGGEKRGSRGLIVPRERASRETTPWNHHDCRKIGTSGVSKLGTTGSCLGHQSP
ncbi:hypothetical protein CC86DRAFT_53586 [Ophiobolus disseminans]|uniref:Uncharacterized protein n=1 Tax=Ophiobolus disseminans TaxID=1469910 RepID=A0A6A6ZTA0_9PLEO|nr:hypothetical protein CC86DRAFT_53586 [Ophiobolus disseminans]